MSGEAPGPSANVEDTDVFTDQAAALHQPVLEARSQCSNFDFGNYRLPLALDVERGFGPRKISAQETNDRGDNFDEGDHGNGPGCGNGRHEPEPQAAINDVVVQVHASGFPD